MPRFRRARGAPLRCRFRCYDGREPSHPGKSPRYRSQQSSSRESCLTVQTSQTEVTNEWSAFGTRSECALARHAKRVFGQTSPSFFQKPSAPSTTASFGAMVSPCRLRSSSSTRQSAALSRLPSVKPTSSFVPSGVAPMMTRITLRFSVPDAPADGCHRPICRHGAWRRGRAWPKLHDRRTSPPSTPTTVRPYEPSSRAPSASPVVRSSGSTSRRDAADTMRPSCAASLSPDKSAVSSVPSSENCGGDPPSSPLSGT